MNEDPYGFHVSQQIGEVDFFAHLQRWKDQAAQTRQTQPQAALDLHYGELPHQVLDYFPAPTTGRQLAPLHIFIHGGFWRRLSKNEFSWVVQNLQTQGISVAVINYGLAPHLRLDEIVDNTKKSFAWLWQQADQLLFDRQHISVSGHSAGGHLAAMLLTTHWAAHHTHMPKQPFEHALLLSPLSDLAPIAATPFLQADLHITEQHIQRLSPVALEPNPGVKIMGAVGAKESRGFKDQLALLVESWRPHFHEVIELPQLNHLEVCDQIGQPDSALFKTWMEALVACRT